MKIFKLKRFWAILLIPFTMCLLRISNSNHETVEVIYSRAIYPVISGIIGRISSLAPFSIAELLLIGALGFVLYHIIMISFRTYIKKRNQNKLPQGEPVPTVPIRANFIASVCCFAGVVYFVWAMICGLNYQRLSFAWQSGMDVRPSPVEELRQLSVGLVAATNTSRELVHEDENGVMMLSAPSYHDTASDAQRTFSYAAQLYPQLQGYVARPKPVMMSPLMSWLDLGGVYVPFTFEANFNKHEPDFNIPSTIMHELAHFKGFMREEEANFISYVACRESGEPDFVYSGNMLAMIYATNALYNEDRDCYWEVMADLSPAVLRDISYNQEYWRQFRGPAAQVSNAVNDVYLRANNQQSGVKSYGQMVDLLLAEWRLMNAQVY